MNSRKLPNIFSIFSIVLWLNRDCNRNARNQKVAIVIDIELPAAWLLSLFAWSKSFPYAYCYWSWDWNATFPHPQLQPRLKSYCVHTATEVEIELPLFLTHNCNRNWKAIVYRIATVTEIEDNNFQYHDCHWYWKLDWAFAETDVRLKFSAKLLSLLLLLHLIFSIIVTDVDTEQNIFVTVFL